MGTSGFHAALLGASLALAGCVSSPAATNASATGAAENGRFHHVHLNVSDIAKSGAFYKKTFGVVPVDYAGKTPALMAERSFIFLNQTAAPIPSQLHTGVIHIGWAGVDGPSEFAGLQAQGVEFYTPLTRFLTGHFMYLYGPDREVIEIWTVEKHHRLNHIHLLSPDPKMAAEWFAKVTNSASPAEAGAGLPGYWKVDFGDVSLDILPDTQMFKPRERTGAIQPTDGAGIDHLAFSFRDLDAALARVTAAGIPVVRPISQDPAYGVRSFFVRSPDGVLVELVEANPLPDAAWN
jgi:catechol 2,3-dioxygenase-like lactoylglutathione lyase family enzyme